ncbi:MAG: histidine kinase dimerization/phosphoacceptor domain -containing protein [Ferruginibacter sp.]
MMRLTFLFLFSYSFIASAQSDKYQDSLQKILKTVENSPVQTEAKFLLGEYLVQRNPEQAEIYADELKNKIKIKADSSNWARLNCIYAASHRWQGNYSTSLAYYAQNYAYYQHRKDFENVAKTGLFIGSINTFLGNNVLAQKHLLEVAEIYERQGTPKQIADIKKSLGGFYLNIDQLEKGKATYLEALEQYKILNDSAGMASINANLGMVYTQLGLYKEAEYHLQEQKKLNVVFPTKREMGFHHDFMGNLRQAQGRIAEAYKEHLTALHIREKLSSTYNLCESKLNMGEVLIKMKRYDEAINQLKDVFSYAEHESLNQQQQAYQLISTAAEAKADYPLALENYKMYKAISDSIYSQASLDIIAEKDAQYKKQEQDAKIMSLNDKNEINKARLSRSSNMTILSIIGLLLLALTATAFYILYKKIKLKNEKINQTLHQKELLMREIHHRVKNNLQIISSLLSLQSRFIEDKSAKDAIQSGRNRVQTMAILHRNLYTENDMMSVDMQTYFGSLIQSVFDSYKLTESDIELKMQVEDIKLDVDSVIPMGLIINELLTNSFKHAFTHGQTEKAEVQVVLKAERNNYLLRVKDNGKGMSEEVLGRTKDESFGQRMIRAFVQKLEASMKIDNSHGTDVCIRIPKTN